MHARRLFKRYDLDESGTVNSAVELQQMTVSLAFALNLAVRMLCYAAFEVEEFSRDHMAG